MKLLQANLLQGIIDCAALGLALMPVEIRLKLFFGFVGVQQKLLARPESQSADIAKRRARGCADETHNLKVPVWHGNIMSGGNVSVKCSSPNETRFTNSMVQQEQQKQKTARYRRHSHAKPAGWPILLE
jgi:hypothetical protein